MDILGHRFLAAFLALIIASASGFIKLSIKKHQLIKILPLALLYPLSFFAFQTLGLVYASSSEAGIISASAPIFTLIFASILLKEKSTGLQKISILASVLGVLYVALMKGATLDPTNMLGIGLLSLSALAIAGYNVLAKSLTKSFSNTELTSVMLLVSVTVFNLLALVRHGMAGGVAQYFLLLTNKSYLFSVIYLGVLSSLVTSLLTNYMLSKLSASQVGSFLNLVTVVSIIAGVLILKEEIYFYHVIGSILIIGGVLGAGYFKASSPPSS